MQNGTATLEDRLSVLFFFFIFSAPISSSLCSPISLSLFKNEFIFQLKDNCCIAFCCFRSNLSLTICQFFTNLVLLISSVKSDSATPWAAACQVSLLLTLPVGVCQTKFISIESVMLSNHLTLCHLLLCLPSIFPSIRVFANESAL